MKNQTIEISISTIIKALLLVLGVAFVYFLRDIVAILLASVVIASTAEPGIRRMMRHGVPRLVSVPVLYLAFLLIFFLAFYLLVPPVAGELRGFVSSFPLYVENALREAGGVFSFLPLDIISPSLTEKAARLDMVINGQIRDFFSFNSSLFGGAKAFVFIMVISFYLAVQEDGVADFLRIVTPYKHEPYVLDLWRRSQRKIGRWFQGQILLGLLVGVLVYLGLTVLGVHFALILAVLSAAFEIIPYFGPIMAAIPGIAVAAVQDPLLGLWVLVLYVMVQQLENHVIYPVVVRKTVGVPPILVIISVLIGSKLGGFFGIILAVPMAVVVVEFLNDIAERKKILGES